MSDIVLPIKLNKASRINYPMNRHNYRNYKCALWSWLSVFRSIEKLKRKGEKSYIQIVSKKYNIPTRTLKFKYREWVENGKLNEIIIKDERGIKNRSFTEEQERELYEYIKDVFINSNLFIDDECIQIMAKKKWDMIYPECKDGFLASNGWVYEFKKRWQLSTRTGSLSRIAVNIDNDKLDDFYNTYDNISTNIGKKFIYNLDETFWRFINKPLNAIGIIGTENRKINVNVDPKVGFTTTLLISANGYFFNPIIILKGKTNRCLKKTGLEDDSSAYRRFNNSGWIDVDIMIFILNLIHSKSNKNRSLLILDEFTVHKNDIVKKEAKRLNIQLLYVPPGKTATNQPLDVSINGAFKSIGRRLEKEIFLSNPFGFPTIADAIKCMIEAKQLIKKETIINAFTRACTKQQK